MWQSIKMPSGRWFVVRFEPGRDTGTREFHKQGRASVGFPNEAQAAARAALLNAGSPVANG